MRKEEASVMFLFIMAVVVVTSGSPFELEGRFLRSKCYSKCTAARSFRCCQRYGACCPHYGRCPQLTELSCRSGALDCVPCQVDGNCGPSQKCCPVLHASYGQSCCVSAEGLWNPNATSTTTTTTAKTVTAGPPTPAPLTLAPIAPPAPPTG